MFAGDDAAEFSGQGHDACHHSVGLVQHGVIRRVDRDIGVDVAIACMHVQGHE